MIEPLNRVMMPTTAMTAAMIHKSLADILTLTSVSTVSLHGGGARSRPGRRPATGRSGHCRPNRPRRSTSIARCLRAVDNPNTTWARWLLVTSTPVVNRRAQRLARHHRGDSQRCLGGHEGGRRGRTVAGRGSPSDAHPSAVALSVLRLSKHAIYDALFAAGWREAGAAVPAIKIINEGRRPTHHLDRGDQRLRTMGCRAPDTRTADVLATGAGVCTVGELLRRVGRSTRTVRGGPEGHWSSAACSIQTQPRRKVPRRHRDRQRRHLPAPRQRTRLLVRRWPLTPRSISLLTGMFVDRFTP